MLFVYHSGCCILFHFYIKPQHLHSRFDLVNRCILFHFYIKPQLLYVPEFLCRRCILFHFYIKPQLDFGGTDKE